LRGWANVCLDGWIETKVPVPLTHSGFTSDDARLHHLGREECPVSLPTRKDELANL